MTLKEGVLYWFKRLNGNKVEDKVEDIHELFLNIRDELYDNKDQSEEILLEVITKYPNVLRDDNFYEMCLGYDSLFTSVAEKLDQEFLAQHVNTYYKDTDYVDDGGDLHPLLILMHCFSIEDHIKTFEYIVNLNGVDFTVRDTYGKTLTQAIVEIIYNNSYDELHDDEVEAYITTLTDISKRMNYENTDDIKLLTNPKNIKERNNNIVISKILAEIRDNKLGEILET